MRNIWRKAVLGLVAVIITATTAFVTTGVAAAATATPSVPAAATAATLTWPLVVQGATGERVVAIQYLLNDRIGAGLVVDGKFGPKTEAAVKAFQKEFKLTVDGKVGPQTWTHLIVEVQIGNSGPAVAAVQHNLRFAYGFTALAVDGIFGPKTQAAVKDFQARFKLGVDGIVGPITWNTLIVRE